MNTSRTLIQRAVALALCGASLAFAPAIAAGQAASTPVAAAVPQVLPGDDLFTRANGDWFARTEIPADRSSWGAFAVMDETTNERIGKLIEAQAADKAARSAQRHQLQS